MSAFAETAPALTLAARSLWEDGQCEAQTNLARLDVGDAEVDQRWAPCDSVRRGSSMSIGREVFE